MKLTSHESQNISLATWNIQSGGGKRIPQIADRLRTLAPDCLLISEYRSVPGIKLREALAVDETIVLQDSLPPPKQNGLLFSSPHRFQVLTDQGATPKSSHRWLPAIFPTLGLQVLGVHVPNQGEHWDKDDFWQHLLLFAAEHSGSRVAILGDFNTGLSEDTEGTPFYLEHCFQMLLDLGWVDCWRRCNEKTREYSWLSRQKKNGFRLDHCFLSPPLSPCLASAYFDHDVRSHGLSDHSLLVVELNLEQR